jgi:hypothetical protein
MIKLVKKDNYFLLILALYTVVLFCLTTVLVVVDLLIHKGGRLYGKVPDVY